MATQREGEPRPGLWALLPTPRTPICHMQARCMTEGCPGGTRGQVGRGFLGKGRMTSRDPGPREGTRDTWEVVLA